MKSPQFPTRRQPVRRGVFRRFHAITGRKQRVAAAASPADFEPEATSGPGIARSLVAMVVLHVAAIGGLIYHYCILDHKAKPAGGEAMGRAVAAGPAAENPPKLAKGEATYMVRAGDSYQSIAQAQGLDENELRAANNNVPVRLGRIFRLPPKKIVAVDPPEVVAQHKSAPAGEAVVPDVPEVEVAVPKAIAVPVGKGGSPAGAGKVKGAQVSSPVKSAAGQTAAKGSSVAGHGSAQARTAQAKPQTAKGQTAKVQAGGAGARSCQVAQGDSIWGIASRNKVSAEAIMKANGITDARRIRPGMKLVIPASH